MKTKAVQLLVNSALPPDLRNYERELDSRHIGDLLAEIGRKYPDQFEGIAKRLSDVGRKASYLQGETLTLSDTRPVIDREKAFAAMDAKIDKARATAKDDDDFRRKRMDIWLDYAGKLEKQTAKAALKKENNLAYSVMSGARGKPAQLKMMITTPALYTDAKDETVPLFIRHSFGDGLRPAEYLAGTYGARKAVLATKRATAKGGDLAKQMVQASANLVVSEHDCGANNGLDFDPDDSSLRGRVLARETAGMPSGTIIDRHAMARLKKSGTKKIIARSPMTCQSKSGVCSKCMGLDAEFKFPSIGESVGITAAQAVGEPICIEGNTLVRMADWSLRKIKEIKPGEYVLGSDMEGNLSPTRVVNVFHNGPRPCVKTVVRKGRGCDSELIDMVTTREHKTLCWSNRNNNPHIRPVGKDCYRMGVYLSKGVKTNQGKSEPWAPLLGLLTGDGSYTGNTLNHGITLSCHEPETEKWASSFLETKGMKLSRMAKGEFRVSMQDQNSDRHVSSTGVLVRNTLRRILQEKKMWGQSSTTKTLPNDIWDWDNKSVAAYIGGYIAADGWVAGKNGVVGMSSISEALTKGIKDLLEVRFGIYGTRVTKKFKKKEDGSHYSPSYEFCISCKADIREFCRTIPIPGVKQAKLENAVATHKRYAKEAQRGRFTIVDQIDVGIQDTWDIEVDNETHLFSLHNSLIVSNTQGALNTKHQGGASSGAKREYSGFNVINQFVQTPEVFPDRAAVAKEEGRVNAVREAPQGGHYIQVNDKEHYVPQGYPVLVKPGDDVEAGDQLAEGLIDPGEIVELRGLGSGRRYYRDRLNRLLEDSGMPTDARNVELLSRAALDHVQVNDADEDDDYLPDDVMSYSYMQATHTPPEDAAPSKLKTSVGRYLQNPTLHYTVGTKITPRMAKRMEEAGIEDVITSAASPKFSPHMVRLRSASHHNPDWLASMHTSYLKKQLQDSSARGRDTDVKQNIHFAPRLAIGVDFGKDIRETGKF